MRSAANNYSAYRLQRPMQRFMIGRCIHSLEQSKNRNADTKQPLKLGYYCFACETFEFTKSLVIYKTKKKPHLSAGLVGSLVRIVS